MDAGSMCAQAVSAFNPDLGRYKISDYRGIDGMHSMIRAVCLSLSLIVPGLALALPSCPASFSQAFDNCEGRYQYDNGDAYSGEWRAGKKHGQGTYVWANGQRYEGQWVDGRKEGFGRYFWPNGDFFEGQFLNGIYHGEGTLTYVSGRKVVGEWVDGKPFKATSFDANGKAAYAYTDGVPQCLKAQG